MPILLGEYKEGTEMGMIKGVNRQMIEVTHTGSPYFERAFLVVRVGSQPPEENLHRQAERVVQQAQTYAGLRRRWSPAGVGAGANNPLKLKRTAGW